MAQSDWAFQKKSLPLPTYLKMKTPQDTIKHKKLACDRIKKKYSHEVFLREVLAQQDMDTAIYLIEVEGIDPMKMTFTKSTGVGRKKKISPLEWAERKKFPEFLAYLRQRSLGPDPSKAVHSDDSYSSMKGDQQTHSSYGDMSESGGDLSEDSSSKRSGEPFQHEQDYERVALLLDSFQTTMPSGKTQFLHWVEMSMVSLIDKKRAIELAPRACWLMCVLVNIFRHCSESSEFVQQAVDFWKSLGPSSSTFSAVRYEDLDSYYAKHPFVNLVSSDLGMGAEARDRANKVGSYMTIITTFRELYLTHFPLEESRAGRFVNFESISASGSSSSISPASSSTTPLSGGVNELPPENASIPRGFLGTLGKEHRERLGAMVDSKASSR